MKNGRSELSDLQQYRYAVLALALVVLETVQYLFLLPASSSSSASATAVSSSSSSSFRGDLGQTSYTCLELFSRLHILGQLTSLGSHRSTETPVVVSQMFLRLKGEKEADLSSAAADTSFFKELSDQLALAVGILASREGAISCVDFS